jgi:hypothetical protein
MMWRRKKSRTDPDAISAQADAATEQLRTQQAQVNALTEYLDRRKATNGFGDDFEWSLIPKESR